MNRKISAWLDSPCLRPDSALRLFCFPYAGGNSSIFRGWQRSVPDSVDVCPVQLPGRGGRFREPMMKRLEAVVKELLTELTPYMDRPFAFFGHSMGALIAFEFARSLRTELRHQPEHLFISGRRPPDTGLEDDVRFDLPTTELVARLRQLNGTPREILDHPEVMEFMLPVVRSDFEIVQTYQYRKEPPLDVAMDVFAGSEDKHASADQMAGWSRQTTGTFLQHIMPGDHFFVVHAQRQLLDLLGAGMYGVLHRIHVRHTSAAQ